MPIIPNTNAPHMPLVYVMVLVLFYAFMEFCQWPKINIVIFLYTTHF
jgi:hypothetical protein